MNLTYTIAGLVMFIFALGLTMWAYSVSSDCGSFWKMLAMSLSGESQQCQYAQYGAPIGVVFMLLGGIVGLGGGSMEDERPDELV